MSQVDDAIREHETRCNDSIEKRLVPWTWMIGIVIALLTSIAGGSWLLASKYTSIDSRTDAITERCEQHEKRLDRLEDMREDVRWIRSKMEDASP